MRMMEPSQALRSLGGNAHAVAVTLGHGGFRGKRLDPFGNPVAAYLAALTARPWLISAGQAIATDTTPLEVLDLPFAVGAFDRAFEMGQYPELERGGRSPSPETPTRPRHQHPSTSDGQIAGRRTSRMRTIMRFLLLGKTTPARRRRSAHTSRRMPQG